MTSGASVAETVAPLNEAVIGAAVGAAPLYSKSSLDFRARNAFERIVLVLLIACSGVAVLTTIGIVFSVLFETLIFFRSVSPVEFLFGTHWSPTGTPARSWAARASLRAISATGPTAASRAAKLSPRAPAPTMASG